MFYQMSGFTFIAARRLGIATSCRDSCRDSIFTCFLRRLSRHGDVMGVAIMPSRILVLSIRWQARARHAGASRVLQNAPDAAGQCGRSPPYCGHTRFGSCRFGWIKMSSPSALRRTIDREWTCPRFWWHFRRFGRASAPDRDPPNQAGHTVNTVKPSVDMLETDLFPTNSISAQV